MSALEFVACGRVQLAEVVGTVVRHGTAHDLRTHQYFEIDHLIATEPQLQDGMFTGRTSGTLNMRVGKVVRLHSWLTGIGHRLKDFESCAHCDSISDLTLLKAVRRSVAVNPGAQLRAEAQARRWRVLQLQR